MRSLVPALAIAALAACVAAPLRNDASPAADSPDSEPSRSLAPSNDEDDIRHFLLQEYPDAPSIQYALAWSDLDGDGSNEAIVYVAGPYFCGTGGCNTLVLTRTGPMWRKVGDISVSRTPVSALKSTSNGWKDLTVDFSGGGMPGGIALLKSDGESYPSNPTVPPAERAEGHGEILIGEDSEMETLQAEAKSGG